MLNKLTIKARLIIQFGFMSLLLAGIGYIGLHGMAGSNERMRGNYEDYTTPIEALSRIDALMNDNIRLTFRVLLNAKHVNRANGSDAYSLDPVEVAEVVKQLDDNTAEIEQLWAAYLKTKIDPDEKVLGDAFAAIRARFLTEGRDPAKAAMKAGDYVEAKRIAMDKMRPLSREARLKLRELITLQLRHSKEQYEASLSDYTDTRNLTIGLVLVGILASLGTGWYVIRTIQRRTEVAYGYLDAMVKGNLGIEMRLDEQDELSRILETVVKLRDKLMGDLEASRDTAEELRGLIVQIQASSLKVNNAITEIAATAKQQEATSVEVAATTTEISATAKEISASSQELARTMNEVSGMADHSAKMAASGQAGLNYMEEAMRQVIEATGGISAKLAVLNEKAANINQVTSTITKVADQTNLLSLNAAIEAEKAGEYGRGFAIVAAEIRRLADQTAVATYDIEQTVKEIQSAVAASVMGMDKFSEQVRSGLHEVQKVGGQLTQVIEQVQGLSPRFDMVNEGVQSQSAGANQITQSLLQLTESMQQTVDALRQTNQSIQDVSEIANNLRGIAAHYQENAT